MAYTQPQICNLALAKLGDVATVSSISPPDGSMQANYCAIYYPQALNVLMDKHAWAFATTTVALVQATNNSNPLWTYAYTLPADYFSLVEIKSAASAPLYYSPYRSQVPANVNAAIEYEVQGSTLYSNFDSAVLVYVSNNFNDPSVYQPMFAEALATLLASYLAGPILKGDTGAAAAQKFGKLFSAVFSDAVENDGQYRRQRPVSVPAGIRSRA